MTDDEKLTRFEVIDETGRVLQFGIAPQRKIQVSVQDEGRTLKVFVAGRVRDVAAGSGLCEEERREVVAVVSSALLACRIPDGFDRNGSHSTGTYQEYEWSLGTYLRPQDEWKATELANAVLSALLETWELKRRGG